MTPSLIFVMLLFQNAWIGFGNLNHLKKIIYFFSLLGYDSGEKKRIPAWCDRVLYRDNRASPTKECSLECPVIASIVQ